jgi:hypothetical protein
MRVVKIIGIVVLVLLALSAAVQLLISGLLLVAALTQNTASLSYIIGRFTGALLLEILIIFGLVKLIRSLRKVNKAEPSDQSSTGNGATHAAPVK